MKATVCDHFDETYTKTYGDLMRLKLGLVNALEGAVCTVNSPLTFPNAHLTSFRFICAGHCAGDSTLVSELFATMSACSTDFTGE